VKGNDRILEKLNDLLADELTAINQYTVQAEMCANWGYKKLHEAIEKQALDEMRHAEWLIARMLFLEGSPTVSRLKAINIGADVPAFLKNNLESEKGAVRSYNDGIRLAAEVQDNGTRELLDKILKAEEGHVDWIEADLGQIRQMGLPPYLAEHLG
jgi:bacterioferritin